MGFLRDLKIKKKYTDKNGKVFILFTETRAKEKLDISKGTFFKYKKQIKELGLINYEEQVNKKNGVSTPIYVTPFDVWLKEEHKYDLPDFH